MIPARFDYAAPATLEQAVGLLASTAGSSALAGGQTLLGELKLRQRLPTLLVDLRKLSELHGIRHRDGYGGLRVGALTTFAELATDRAVRSQYPVLAEAAEQGGDPQVRHRGTLGGNLMAATPGADLCAAVLALESTVLVTGPNGSRSISAEELFATPLGPGEILIAVDFPPAGAAAGSAYEKFKNPASGFAICGVAASIVPTSNRMIGSCRVAVTGAVARPVRLVQVEAALVGRSPSHAGLAAATALASQGLELVDDLAASGEYRGYLAGVLAERALVRAAERAGLTFA